MNEFHAPGIKTAIINSHLVFDEHKQCKIMQCICIRQSCQTSQWFMCIILEASMTCETMRIGLSTMIIYTRKVKKFPLSLQIYHMTFSFVFLKTGL